MGNVTIKEVKSKTDLRKFIHLPEKIHRNHKNWVPPFYADEWQVFDSTKNPSFQLCDTILYLAEKDGELVGRIMGIINHSYNESHNENNGRFCFMECYDDDEVFDILIKSVENWAREKGMVQLVGPLGFSDKDPEGFLIYGFDDPVTVLVSNCSFPYMITKTERNGYIKKEDMVEYRIDVPQKTPEIYETVYKRTMQRGYTIYEFTKSRQIVPFVKQIFDLINTTYYDISGFSPITDREVDEFAKRFLPLVNPDFVKVITNQQDEIVAFIAAMPDISNGLRRAHGKLFPFGFIPILYSLKRSKQLNLLLGCISENIRSVGLNALLTCKMFEAARRNKIEIIDSHLVMETNMKMRAELERVNGVIYKKYRIFKKEL